MNYQNFSYISDIIGKPVQNSLGQEYGEVSDIILSATHRRAVAIIVKKGGFLGMGGDYFVLPWQKIRINPNTNRVLVEADRKTIEDAPLLELDNIKNGDPETLTLIYSYWGVDEFWKQSPQEAQPMDQDYGSGEDTGERLPTNEGSHQITKHYPGPEGSDIREEANYDKIQGLGNTNNNQ